LKLETNEKNAIIFNKWRNGRFALFGCHQWRLSRAIKANLHSYFVSNTTVASFRDLQREEEASIGHTQFTAGKCREESLQRQIGKFVYIYWKFESSRLLLVILYHHKISKS
jgi:hypothetical protein